MNTTRLFTLILFASFLATTHADLVASSNETTTPAQSKDHGDGLRDLNSCAEGISSGFFHRDGQELVSWAGYGNQPMNPIKAQPVATSVFVERGLPPDFKPGFITTTNDKVLFTEAKMSSRHASQRVDKHTTLTLNLLNRFSPRNGLPIVDPRDTTLPAWAYLLEWDKDSPSHGAASRRFSLSEAAGAVTKIEVGDALTGDRAVQATDILKGTLRDRLAGTADNVKSIYRHRQMLRSDRIGGQARHPFEFFLTAEDLKELRLGLCGCDSLFEEAEGVRRELTKPDGTLRVWEKGATRALRPTDLGCGMV